MEVHMTFWSSTFMEPFTLSAQCYPQLGFTENYAMYEVACVVDLFIY